MGKTSRYKGVRAERGKFRADIQVNKKKKFLGYFDSEVLAAQAYNDAVSRFGLKRKINKIAAIVKPNTINLEMLSTKAQFLKVHNITTTDVKAVNPVILDLTDAVKRELIPIVKSGGVVTANAVQKSLQKKSCKGEFLLLQEEFKFMDGSWQQEITLERVSEILEELHTSRVFKAKKNSDSEEITYNCNPELFVSV